MSKIETEKKIIFPFVFENADNTESCRSLIAKFFYISPNDKTNIIRVYFFAIITYNEIGFVIKKLFKFKLFINPIAGDLQS